MFEVCLMKILINMEGKSFLLYQLALFEGCEQDDDFVVLHVSSTANVAQKQQLCSALFFLFFLTHFSSWYTLKFWEDPSMIPL